MLVDLSASQIEPWLASGSQIRPGRFTYSIPGPGSIWLSYGFGGEASQPGFAYADAQMAAAFVSAIGLWDELIAPDFIQVADNAYSSGELRIAVTDMDDKSAAYAYYPSNRVGKSSDIWFNDNQAPWNWSKGGYDFHAMIHEVGHAIGLKHSFEGDPAPAEFDSHRFTVMSYTSVTETFVNFGYEGNTFYAYFPPPFAQTPMVLDIAAIQEIYGAEPATRADDTTYRFTQFHGGLQTIYDAGGNDTFDLSGFTLDNKIDLASGAYSSIGIADVDAQIAYWTSLFPQNASFIAHVFQTYVPSKGMVPFEFRDNVGIALSSVIENAIGGSGNDEISGNEAANVLKGGAGDDILSGLGGSDELYGGEGNDTLWGNATGSVHSTAIAPDPNNQVLITITTGNGLQPSFRPAAGPSNSTSSITSYGNGLFILFSSPADTQPDDLTPTPAPAPAPAPLPSPVVPDIANVDDRLDGGAGNDSIIGGPGQDILTGGSGSDRFVFHEGDFAGSGPNSSDRILDFNAAEGDRIDLSAIDAITGGGDDAFSFIDTSAFGGTAGELRYQVSAGYALVTGDLDGDRLPDITIRLDGITTVAAGSFIL